MSFFNRLDKAVNRGYSRWGKWIWAAIIAPFIIYGAYIVWAAIWGPPTGPVTLVIHSEIDRPILGFSVNGVAGANSSAHDKNNPYASGPGKTTCCGDISGNVAHIIWTLDMTHEQYLKGMRLEKRELKIPMPKREWGENYLHVYFFPKDKVRLWWGAGFVSPTAGNMLNATTSDKTQD